VRWDEHDRAREWLLGRLVVFREQPTGREQEWRHQDRAERPTQRLHDGSIPAGPDGADPVRAQGDRAAVSLRV
jgi:hypothetical protein